MAESTSLPRTSSYAAASLCQVAIDIPLTPSKCDVVYLEHMPQTPSTHVAVEDPAWYRITRPHLRECVAECFGVFICALIGLSANQAVVMFNSHHAAFLTSAFAWGVGVMFGIHVCKGVSGSHLNSAVTLSLALYRGFPWWKVPGYLLAQCLGCFLAAGAVFALNFQALTLADPERTALTRGRFATYPAEGVTNWSAFLNEFMAGFVLIVGVCALGDPKNHPAKAYNIPVHFFYLISAICFIFGLNTSCALNPARDLGPRIFTLLAGYGTEVFTAHSHYYWIPVVGPLLGGAVGGGCYQLLIRNHHPRGADGRV